MTNILNWNAIQAVQTLVDGTLGDTATIYSATDSDNGLGTDKVYALRDVQPCRAVSLTDQDKSNAERVLDEELVRVTLPANTPMNIGDKVVVTGSVNLTGYVRQDNYPRSTESLSVVVVLGLAD